MRNVLSKETLLLKMRSLGVLVALSAFLIGASSCPKEGTIKIYALLAKPEDCADFRGPGCYRYDDRCKLLEYLPIEKCHQYQALSPEDANTVLELVDQCMGKSP